MSNIMPEGDRVRKAVKWIAGILEQEPDKPIAPLVNQATLRFDLNPRESQFLLSFYQEARSRKA